MPTKQLYHTTTSPEYKTIGDFISNPNSPAFVYNTNPEGLLKIKEGDVTNEDRIRASYNPSQKELFKNLKGRNLPLKSGTLIYLEYDKVNEPSFAIEGIEVVSYDEPAFKAAKLAKLEADKGYVQVIKPIDGFVQNGSLKYTYPQLTVWLWVRALSGKLTGAKEEELKGQFIDISPFIDKCSTNMGKNGGSFQITLPPLVCELDENEKWVISRKSIIQGEEYLSEASLFNDNLERNQFYFNSIISSNDLIYIRFETLHLEKDQRYSDASNYYVNKNQIASGIYDMIGLVDGISQSVNPASNEVAISINGRDLSKLFLDDGTYFYALENSQGLLKLAGQSTQKNSLINRIFGNGALSFIGLYTFTSIEHILKFIVQQLSTIKIVPNDLFVSYGDERNKRFDEYSKLKKPEDKKRIFSEIYKEELAAGIWQIVKLVIDESVTGRVLADSSLSTANGSLMNFIRSACQEPLVEFYMDTYDNMYHLIVRKPPTDRTGLISLIEGKVNTEDNVKRTPAIIDIEQYDVLQEKLMMNDDEVYSWYNFTPRNALTSGDSTNYSLSYIGALYFEEYAEIFGSRPFDQTHSYLPYVPMNNTDKIEIHEKQAIEDLTYVVESNQYLPFTRKGTIVINGDRRVKIGNVIRYKSTGEIFFVDNVQQNFSINENSIERTTVLHVSRGMIEQLIYGVHLQTENGTSKYVSYFNIINTTTKPPKENKVTTHYTESVPTGFVKSTNEIAEPGFGEYMMHQQGAGGARQIAKAVMTGSNTVSAEVYGNMFKHNVGFDFVGDKTPINFYNYWLKRYNRAYASAQKSFTPFDTLYAQVSKETGVPFLILKTFATIESNNTNAYNPNRTYQGLFQVSNEEAKSFGLSAFNPAENVKTAAFIYLRNTPHNPFVNLLSGNVQEYKDVQKTKTEITLDMSPVFSNFKVDKYIFNFFLKKQQFDPAFKNINSRVVYKSEGVEMPNVIVTGKKKKK